MSNPPPLAFIVRSKLIFEKLDNGNVLLRKYGTSEIIASFPPNQIVTKDISSISNIIIKSALTNERGVVINVKNIDVAHCTPVIASSYIDDIISDLSNLFFFEVSKGGLQHIPFFRTITPANTDNNKVFYNSYEELSGNLSKSVLAVDAFCTLKENYNIQSNVLFFCNQKTKLISYSGMVYKTGFSLQIYKGTMGTSIEDTTFNLRRFHLLASIPLDSYQQRIDLTTFIAEPIYENEVVVVSYKSPVGSGLESYFWFNGTFTTESVFPSSVAPAGGIFVEQACDS